MKRNEPKTKSAAPPKARVLLVDDHPIVREGLRRVIDAESDLTVCGEAVSRRQGLDAVEKLKPDIAVVDVSLEGSHGLELVKDLRVRHPQLPVLMLSMHDEALYAERALKAGAKGYLMKREPPEKLLRALRRALQGELAFSEAFTAQVLSRTSDGERRPETPTERLSDRELEVLEMLGKGLKTRQIAEQLYLSVKTIQAYREHLKAKLDLPDGASLMRFAVQWVERGQGV
jgi:DNA-binding NarL/FixJ family response regulator